MDRRWSFVIVRLWKLWQFSSPDRRAMGVSWRRPPIFTKQILIKQWSANSFERAQGMHSGTTIEQLFSAVKRAEHGTRSRPVHSTESRPTLRDPHSNVSGCCKRCDEGRKLQSEEFAQSLRLGAAHRNFGLLFVVHAQLIRALEPGNDFADTIDVYQVGAVCPPKKIRV
jgi:hypothetical protein